MKVPHLNLKHLTQAHVLPAHELLSGEWIKTSAFTNRLTHWGIQNVSFLSFPYPMTWKVYVIGTGWVECSVKSQLYLCLEVFPP